MSLPLIGANIRQLKSSCLFPLEIAVLKLLRTTVPSERDNQWRQTINGLQPQE